MIWFLLGLAAAVAVSVWAYNFLEGETLIHDLFDEARLIAHRSECAGCGMGGLARRVRIAW